MKVSRKRYYMNESFVCFKMTITRHTPRESHHIDSTFQDDI